MIDGKVLKEDWREYSIGAIVIQPILGAKALKAINEEAKEFIKVSETLHREW